jgi:periplasmic divalent cation tolerance protein
MSSTNIVALYITCPNAETASTLATALVTERLVACANIIPSATSIYHLDGQVHRAEEVLMICQTSIGVADSAIARAKKLHPAELPCITLLPVEGGLDSYLRWIKDQLV